MDKDETEEALENLYNHIMETTINEEESREAALQNQSNERRSQEQLVIGTELPAIDPDRIILSNRPNSSVVERREYVEESAEVPIVNSFSDESSSQAGSKRSKIQKEALRKSSWLELEVYNPYRKCESI